MKNLSPNQLRSAYLKFFEDRGHTILPSTPLVPENDPTTLFTGSGMQPMMPYLLGATHPGGRRLADSQKCFRSQDIEDVGDNRHTTFFEMLGNWSLGDYFKSEQLSWFYQFLTQEVGLDPSRLYVSVFSGNSKLGIPSDDEAASLWQEIFTRDGIEAMVEKEPLKNGYGKARIFYYDETVNWWSRAGEPSKMPIGEPGGPDSEVFYDFGPKWGFHERSQWAKEPCHINCDCGRFLEIGNSVFMTYRKVDESNFEPLAQKNIDFGGGLERILAAAADSPDVFVTKAFTPIISELEGLSQKKYQPQGDDPHTHSFRVLADHLRAAVMLAGDGVLPGNKEQAYFSRRLLRRAIREAKRLGITKPFLGQLVPIVAEIFKEPYPEINDRASEIASVFSEEEGKFARALDKGMRLIDKASNITTELAFDLYQSCGFPFELTAEIASERGTKLDQAAFQDLRTKHAADSREASAGKFKGGLADQSETATKYHTATHLLQAALRAILGDHVAQHGSNITGQRLRFDFSHQGALTQEQKEQVEALINDWIEADLKVTNQMMNLDEALKAGAIAFFREKYPPQVSVYTIGADPNGLFGDLSRGWISKELCGGPHVDSTGQIGQIKIFKEQSVAAGVRRLYLQLV